MLQGTAGGDWEGVLRFEICGYRSGQACLSETSETTGRFSVDDGFAQII